MKMRIAILDDYQGISMKLADWASIPGRPEIKVFTGHVFDLEQLAERLLQYDILCIMRERTPMTAAPLPGLPQLKLIGAPRAPTPPIVLPCPLAPRADVC